MGQPCRHWCGTLTQTARALALAVRLRRPAEASLGSLTATGAALTLSAWVGINGAVFDQRTLEVCHDNHYARESLCWYVPEFSALWRPFVVPSASLVTQGAYGVYCGVAYLVLMAPIVAEFARRSWSSLAPGSAAARALAGWRFWAAGSFARRRPWPSA